MGAFAWYTLTQAYTTVVRVVVLAIVALLGLSAATAQTPNQLVGSIKDTVEVFAEVNVAIEEVGGLEGFLKLANTWLEQELAK